MPKIFVFTAGNPEAQEHLTDSIANPVSRDTVFDAARSPEERALFEDVAARAGAFFAWGATPGPVNERNWASMEVGDAVLCVYDRAYRDTADVVGKIRHSDLAKAIWGTDPDGQTWEYMYFLTKPRPVAIPLTAVADHLHAAYRGFARISDERVAKITRDFHSVAAFLRAKFTSGQAARPGEAFLALMKSYRADGTVFQSPDQGSRYHVVAVTNEKATIGRIDASEAVDVTASLCEARVAALAKSGTLPRAELSSTVAIQMALC